MRLIFKSSFVLLLVTLWCVPRAGAQLADTLSYERHAELAKQYETALLYAEASEQWRKVARLAKKAGAEKVFLNARISMAELMRQTRDFDIGLELLHQLTGTEQYPVIHVRKLGRFAALHHEGEDVNLDSVNYYLSQALRLSEQYGLDEKKAELQKELGYMYYNQKAYDKSLLPLYAANTYYKSQKDTGEYVNSLILILRNYLFQDRQSKTDSTIDLLLQVIHKGNWNRAKLELYNMMAFAALKRADSLSYYKWRAKGESLQHQVLENINTNRMSALRVLYDNEKYQAKAAVSAELAAEREKELELEATRKKALLIFIFILAISVLVVAFLLLRERRLKRSVKVANEKYQMLMVESNHRIKNNLQMIISMLEYTKKDMSEQDALKRMRGKIHTVSALHRYLTAHIHDQLVPAGEYFSDIIDLYENISEAGLQVTKHFTTVSVGGERMVYFGLILNEMLANTLEHKPGPTRKVEVYIRPDDKKYSFIYRDGPGRIPGATPGTGSKLINGLVERIGGTNFTFDHVAGQYQFHFKVYDKHRHNRR